MKALECFEPEEKQNKFAICLGKFYSYENLSKINLQNLEKEKLNLHGTLLIQAILNFNKPIKMINSLLNLDSIELKGLISNTMGSHVVDSYMKSNFVGEKSRERFVRKLQVNTKFITKLQSINVGVVLGHVSRFSLDEIRFEKFRCRLGRV